MSTGSRARATPRMISVVVPVRNCRRELQEQLASIGAQEYEGSWELVIADNGSRDGTRRLALDWLEDAGHGRLVDAGGRRGPAYARNAGAAAARGDLILFCDGDDRVAPGWLAAMADAARTCDIVAGRLRIDRVNEPLVRAWHVGQPKGRPQNAHGFLPFAATSNCGIWRDCFRALGAFDERLRAGEDIDLSWRAQIAGRRLGFAPEAVVDRRYRSSLRRLAVQHLRYGVADVSLFVRFRHAGMAPVGLARAVHEWLTLAAAMPGALRSRELRGTWVRQASLRLGRAYGSLCRRVVYL